MYARNSSKSSTSPKQHSSFARDITRDAFGQLGHRFDDQWADPEASFVERGGVVSAPELTISAFGTLPTGDPRNVQFRTIKSKGYKAKKLTSPAARSRRNRTEREAIKQLDAVHLSPSRRQWAITRIRNARQPTVEARRFVERAEREMTAILAGRLDPNGEVEDTPIELADVQELRARIIRREGMLDQPQASLLARMDLQVATKSMTEDEFTKLTTALFGEAMRPALPLSVRWEAARC